MNADISAFHIEAGIYCMVLLEALPFAVMLRYKSRLETRWKTEIVSFDFVGFII